SDFRPALTTTTSGRISTTVPVTMAPERSLASDCWLCSNSSAKLSVMLVSRWERAVRRCGGPPFGDAWYAASSRFRHTPDSFRPRGQWLQAGSVGTNDRQLAPDHFLDGKRRAVDDHCSGRRLERCDLAVRIALVARLDLSQKGR